MDALDFWRLATFVSIFLLMAVTISWLCFWTQNKNRKRRLWEQSAQMSLLEKPKGDKLEVPDIIAGSN